MIINLTGDRRIITDTYGYNLQKLGINKGDPVWTSYKYYMTLQGLCKGVSEQLLRETDAIGLPEIITALKGLEKVIGQAVEEQSLGVTQNAVDRVKALVEELDIDLDETLEDEGDYSSEAFFHEMPPLPEGISLEEYVDRAAEALDNLDEDE